MNGPFNRLSKSKRLNFPFTMKKEEVSVAPDGSLLLHPFEIERQARHYLTYLYSVGVLATAEKLQRLAKQAVWEDNALLLRIVVDTIVSHVSVEPESTCDLALVCGVLATDASIYKIEDGQGVKPSARDLIILACQNRYEEFWRQVLTSIGENERREHLNRASRSQVSRGRALVLFIGYLYEMNIVPGSVVMHVVVEHGRNVIELPEECLENLSCLLEIVGPKLATSARNHVALEKTLTYLEVAAESLRVSLKRRLILKNLVLECYNWEPVGVDEGSSPIRGICISEF